MVALAHEVIVNAPIIGKVLRKFGVVKAGPSVAAEVLNAGANVLVYPGGDVEALRPWKDRNKIVFDGRKGFLRLAHSSRVKIVPVVAVGGQETFFVLNDGRKMAQRLGIDKKLRAKTVPFSLSIPWGLMLGDLPHIPVPAKIRMQVLPPIDVREMFGDDPDWDQAYGYVTSLMQVALSDLAAKTVVPVFG
jgi:1-acyl-sn-glycerol-3-phosphate acyltransferase